MMQPDFFAREFYAANPSTMLQSIWRSLKRLRKIKLGPVALAFKFERAVHVTPDSRHRLRNPLRRQPPLRVTQPSPTQPNWSDVHQLHSAPTPHSQLAHATPSPEVALIVGVGPGLGYAMARRLASEGLSVVMASRNAIRLGKLADEIGATGGVAFAYGCDATNEQSVADLFAHVLAEHGAPSLVVYSLQSFGPGETMDVELPAFEEGWRHNCLGAFLVARAAARAMVPRQRGTIILIGSTSSVLGRAGHLNLAVGKFGQRAIAQVMARELWPKGIHVAHLMIDADIQGELPDERERTQSDPQHIADILFGLHRQSRTAWTSEIDARPWNENFWEHC